MSIKSIFMCVIAFIRRARSTCSRVYWDMKFFVSYCLILLQNNFFRDLHKPIIVIGHELSLSGSPLLLHRIIEDYIAEGYNPVYIVNKGAEISEQAWNKLPVGVKPIIINADTLTARLLFRYLRNKGCTQALCNTIISGSFAKVLSENRIESVFLIHEMLASLTILNAQTLCADVCKYAKKIVFPHIIVKNSFFDFMGNPDISNIRDKIEIIPQGVYFASADHGRLGYEKAHQILLEKFNLPENAIVLLSAGNINFGKGVDVCIPVIINLKRLEKELGKEFYVIWLGSIADQKYYAWMQSQINSAHINGRILFPGFVNERNLIQTYMEGADALLLPSREDSYPSAALEAIEMGTPVVAFANTGGGSELAMRQNGHLAISGDIGAYIQIILDVCVRNREVNLGKCRTYREQTAEDRDFKKYSNKILELIKA